MQAEIMLSTPSFNDHVLVRVLDVSCSWNVTEAGTLTALVERDIYEHIPFDTILDKWVAWDSPAGLWGGTVDTVTYHLASHYVELGCRSFHDLLSSRRTGVVDLPGRTAGGIVSRAIGETMMSDPALISEYQVEEIGQPISHQLRDDDLSSVVSTICGTVGAEWRVSLQKDYSLLFEFRKRLGRNKSGDVYLIEGIHFFDGTITETVNGMYNDIKAMATDDDYANSASNVVTNGHSIKQYRRRQTVRKYEGLVKESVLTPQARADMEKTAYPAVSFQMNLHNVEEIFERFEEGDTVTVVSETADSQRMVRILSRTIHSDGSLDIAGEAWTAGEAAAVDGSQ